MKGRALASSSHLAVSFPVVVFVVCFFLMGGGGEGCFCHVGELNWLMERLTNASGSVRLRMRREPGTSLFVNSELLQDRDLGG